ncbi:S6 family peptidase [Edwardsiella hoshinae]|uniref:S6 family peptidase n=1 Tax=Edwardsiella hoshinae TaxID=93378 RepID=UPI0009F2E7AC|nr:S6 family peptidase [Edwardsiella hoshinae]
MNKIFSLKYSASAAGYIAVAEICRGAQKSGTARRPSGVSLLLFFSALLSVPPGIASVVSDEIPYLVFRDFAENKGEFQPGTKNIKIYDKSGALVGVLDQAPFPDFSSVSAFDNDTGGIATLVAPQYIASVAHNRGYSAVAFGYRDDGSNRYRLVDRNDYPDNSLDFHLPRLNKIVTEVVPTPMTTAGTVKDTYKNTTRFPVFYRVGSGRQYTKTRDGRLNYLQGPYIYMTGGTIGVPQISDRSIVSNPGNTFDPVNGPLASYGTPGDSGSPLYTYDAYEGRWVLVAVARAYSGDAGATNWWVVLPSDFIRTAMAEDNDPAITPRAGQGALLWTYNSDAHSGTLSQPQSGVSFSMHGPTGEDLNTGKNLTFQRNDSGTGGGEIVLQSNIDQGAGVLTFDADYRVSAQNGQTWQGGGVIINQDKQVDWQLNGVAGDNLHRLGTGTLHINGMGENPGGLKVGDGLTLLDQRPDAAGKVRAFRSLNIASGRPTVKLMADQQLDPDSITWGFRGGTLDANGHDLTFHRLNMADYGAQLTNSASETATVTLDLRRSADPNYLVHGRFSGKLDLVSQMPGASAGTLAFDGGIDIDGTLSASGQRLLFQGHPRIHARDYSRNRPPVSAAQPDWEERQFTLNTLALTQTDFSLARNATMQGDIQANASNITLNDSQVFVDNLDGEGVAMEIMPGISRAPGQERSRYRGNISLNNRSSLDSGGRSAGAITARGGDIRLQSVAEHQGDITLSAADLTIQGNHQGAISADGGSRVTLARGSVQNGDITLTNAATLTMANRNHSAITAAASRISLTSSAEHQGVLALRDHTALTLQGRNSGIITAAASEVTLAPGAEHRGIVALRDHARLALQGRSNGAITASASEITLAPDAEYRGTLDLREHATLASQGHSNGAITASASEITLASDAEHRGTLDLREHATLASQGHSNGTITAEASQLTLQGKHSRHDGEVNLSNNATLFSQGFIDGDIHAVASQVTLENDHRGNIVLTAGATLTEQGTVSSGNGNDIVADNSQVTLESGYERWGGAITLRHASTLISKGNNASDISADGSRVSLEGPGMFSGNLALANGSALTLYNYNRSPIVASASQVTLTPGSEHRDGAMTLSDNAALTIQGRNSGTIMARHSTVTLDGAGQHHGDIALNDNARLTVKAAAATPISAAAPLPLLRSAPPPQLSGAITLHAQSTLDSEGQSVATMTASNASAVHLGVLSRHTGPITLQASTLNAAGVSVGDWSAGNTSTIILRERGQQLGDINLANGSRLMAQGDVEGKLHAEHGRITLQPQGILRGDIHLEAASRLISEGKSEGALRVDASSVTLQGDGLHRGAVTLDNGAMLAIQAPTLGTAPAETRRQLQGDVHLMHASSLISAGRIDGKLSAADSTLYLGPGSQHQGGDIALNEGAILALDGRNQSAIKGAASLLTLGRSAEQQGDITLSHGAFLTSAGRSHGVIDLNDSGAYFGPESQHRGDLYLTGDNARLALLGGAALQGDLHVAGESLLRFGVKPAMGWPISATPSTGGTVDYRGRIAAPQAHVEMYDTLWRMSGDSRLAALQAENSLISATGSDFMTLNVDRLHADGALVALRADEAGSDRLVINERLSGNNNVVLVNYLEPTLPQGRLNVSLISAPAGSDRESFRTHLQPMGFSEVMPELITRESDGQMDWVLSGFAVAPDAQREEDAVSLLSLNYRRFMAEVQYLDKRQLDLRNDPSASGVWARLLHGAGSAAENYRDRYLHLQLGADRRYALRGTGELLAGATFTVTDGRASGDAFSSRSRTLGAGLYATALFPSGWFVDLNGKYAHQRTAYQVSLAGLGERQANNHAWYARADVGYRYALSEHTFIEPHLELVSGGYSSTRFDWQDHGMAVSLAQPGFTPLLATAGLALGKHFISGQGQTTLRMAIDYQSELLTTGDTQLRDASGERTIRGDRDARLRYSLGIESRISDALQLGLEVERSSFGDYNLDYSLQATLRYRF